MKRNVIVLIAMTLAIATSMIIKPDKLYFKYIDFRTLSMLFCMLVIVCGFEDIHFFQILSRQIVKHFKTIRSAVLVLIYITFIGSKIIANDMALITFLPLGCYVLKSTKQEKYMAFVFVMQNIAANLGGMLTPFGNPQNLYLYSYYHIGINEFIQIMFWPFAVSILLITICTLFLPKDNIEITDEFDKRLNVHKVILYFILFGISLAIIFKYIPYHYGLLLILGAFIIVDRKIIKKVDYPLLMTFFAFFIFSGNIARIPLISKFLSKLLSQSTLITGVLSCQIISNVPSAILLSKFATNYSDLLIAVNIGGAGTLIASLASLITFREYIKHNPDKQWYYIKIFSAFNFTFLIILTSLSLVF